MIEHLTATYDVVSRLAQIEIEEGNVRLLCDWNVDGPEDDEAHIQRYEYGPQWTWPVTEPRLVDEWFAMCDERNGEVCGGICIDDFDTYDQVQELLDICPIAETKEIATLHDGVYLLKIGK